MLNGPKIVDTRSKIYLLFVMSRALEGTPTEGQLPKLDWIGKRIDQDQLDVPATSASIHVCIDVRTVIQIYDGRASG